MNTITIQTTKELYDALGTTINELIAMDDITEDAITGRFQETFSDDSTIETLTIEFPHFSEDDEENFDIWDNIIDDLLSIVLQQVGLDNKPEGETHYYIYNDNESVLIKLNDETITIVYQNTNQN